MFRLLGFKQTRDVQNLRHAYFQEVTLTPLKILRIMEGPVPMETNTFVIIKHFPTHPIFSQLGLIPAGPEARKAVRPFLDDSETGFHVAQAMAPFWMRYERQDLNPISLLWRSTAMPWRPGRLIAELLRSHPGMDLRTAIRLATQGNKETSYAM